MRSEPRRSLDPSQVEDGSAGRLTREAWVEVDLARLRQNHQVLRAALPPTTLLGIVVKADGYGHGMEAVARVAADESADGGAALLMVATLEEGVRLRDAGIDAPVLVLYPVHPAHVATVARAGLALTVAGLRAAQELALAAEALPADVGSVAIDVHLEVETGMSRGGMVPGEVVAAARAVARSRCLRHAGTWSHIASPEDAGSSAAQVSRFETALDALREAGIDPGIRHIASSGPLLCTSTPSYDLVRIGLAWYGIVPPEWTTRRPELTAALRPALSLKARPIRVARIPAGTGVGYGGAWTATRSSIIATLQVGYADGYARGSWPGARALVRGRSVPIVGRVSMDAITVDVTDVGEVGEVGPDDEFVLLGPQGDDEIPALELSALRGTIEWEVVSMLGRRLPRVYRDTDEAATSLSPLHPA